MQPFLALITPIGEAPTPPPDPNAPRPTHPIMLPGMPGWGVPPGAHPSHPIMLPGMPGWGQWPNVPTHPIMLPGMPGWGEWPTPPVVTPPPTGPGPKPPGAGEATPPGSVPPHPSTGIGHFYVWVPYVGMVGPIYVPPGVTITTPPPPVTEPPVTEPPTTPA